MKEIIEFRINNNYAHLLLKPGEGKSNYFNTIIKITRGSLFISQPHLYQKNPQLL